ncbi:hypothetical protein FISHEDRAFT_77736 [Fistulina hepatica ATCC 64428]|nr:hypothetical protein FISHEDRAFT_77736 [Fistulina hepatica ATCC 64428]
MDLSSMPPMYPQMSAWSKQPIFMPHIAIAVPSDPPGAAGAPPVSIPPETHQPPPVPEPATGKRKRQLPAKSPATEPSTSTAQNAVPAKRARTANSRRTLTTYKDHAEMLTALKAHATNNDQIDFSATYSIHDSASNDRLHIRGIVDDIFKTTGYKFTIKDHPQLKEGHKTRFWCAQDEVQRARKYHGSVEQRVDSSGKTVGKIRFPCRSSLLVSVRGEGALGQRVVTIRLHHHHAHEAFTGERSGMPLLGYSAPPPMHPPMGQPFEPPPMPISAMTSSDIQSLIAATAPPAGSVHGVLPPTAQFQEEEEEDEEDEDSEEDRSQALTPEHFRARMVEYITLMRSFCDGLQYQLQFNDFGMLDALEKEGGAFFNFMRGCLEKERQQAAQCPPPPVSMPPPPGMMQLVQHPS